MRRTARAFWMTTVFTALAGPALIVAVVFVMDAIQRGSVAESVTRAASGVFTLTLVGVPFAFVTVLVLMTVCALPTVKLVRETQFEHVLTFIAVATFCAALLPSALMLLNTLSIGRMPRGSDLRFMLVAGAVLAPAGAVVGLTFWRLYAGRWCWRIRDRADDVASVF